VSGAIALIKVTGFAVVGDEQVELTVVVEVGPQRGQPVTAIRIADPGLLRHVREGTVAFVVPQCVR